MDSKTGVNFLNLLECPLDNLVYRLGFASTRAQARQLVNHGHIVVDGKKVDIPSYRVKPGQTIAMKEASKDLVIVKAALEAKISRPAYVSFDADKNVGSLVRIPERDEFLTDINEQLIVEFYNRA
jgi:small subunit ribosomal protein S4